MSAPHLLLVDDSQAILAYETAVLGGHYTISTAVNGKEGLRLAGELKPNLMLLDLSMPEMDGFEVLERMKADPKTAPIPIIVISTEQHRADSCIQAGAADFVPKPIRAETLRAVVSRVLAEAQREDEKGSLGVLVTETSGVFVGIDLDTVVAATLQPATAPLVTGCAFVREVFEFRGQPVCVLDVAARLEKKHERPLIERKLVIVKHDPLLAICVDDVHEPELVPRSNVLPANDAAGHGLSLARGTTAVVRSGRGEVPIVDPPALIPAEILAALPAAILASNVAMMLARDKGFM